MKKLITTVVAITLLWSSANTYSQSPKDQNIGMRDYSSGEVLYESRCQFCHGIKGDGNGAGSSVLVPRPSDFTDSDFWKYRNDENIAQTLINGHGKGMPAFRFLPEDIKSVIDYISHFKKPDGK
jgi:mono/diheme cytochrome c family protein